METRQAHLLLDRIDAYSQKNNLMLSPDESLLPDLGDQLARYFEGNLFEFRVDYDLTGCSDFTVKVLVAAAQIPYAQTVSYQQLAEKIRQPRSCRAVARALAANPLPIVIPCHRVIYSTGLPGGYTGACGPDFKIKLLELEKSHKS